MAITRVTLIAAFAAMLGIGALTATANAWTSCTTNCYGNTCTRTCF